MGAFAAKDGKMQPDRAKKSMISQYKKIVLMETSFMAMDNTIETAKRAPPATRQTGSDGVQPLATPRKTTST